MPRGPQGSGGGSRADQTIWQELDQQWLRGQPLPLVSVGAGGSRQGVCGRGGGLINRGCPSIGVSIPKGCPSIGVSMRTGDGRRFFFICQAPRWECALVEVVRPEGRAAHRPVTHKLRMLQMRSPPLARGEGKGPPGTLRGWIEAVIRGVFNVCDPTPCAGES